MTFTMWITYLWSMKQKSLPSNQLTLLPLSHISRENEILFQANALTSAYYDMSALQKNILYLVQSQLKKDDSDTRRYVVRVKDLMEIKKGLTNPYADLQRATEGMMQKIMNIPVNGKLLQVAPFSSVLYDFGEGTMTFELSPSLRPFLFNLEGGRFTTFEKEPAVNLSSKYAKRIYEMVSQWKKAGVMRITIIELKTRLRLYDPVTSEEQYVVWGDFNKRVLQVAIREINECSDLHLKMYTHKDSRAISEIRFVIKVKQTVPIQEQPTPSELHKRLLVDFKLREDQIKFILDRYAVEVIHQKLYDITIHNNTKKITNIGAYTAKVFGVQ